MGTTFGISIPLSNRKLAQPANSLEVLEFGETSPQSEELRDGKEARSLNSLKEKTVLVFDDHWVVHEHWKSYAEKHPYITMIHFKSWEDFVAHAELPMLRGAVAFVDIHYTNSAYDGFHIANCLKQIGLRQIYAITSDKESAKDSGLFDGVFGKEVPSEISELVA